jgi:deazaflavin-dependent oxidoreductase (nitroreductase family)
MSDMSDMSNFNQGIIDEFRTNGGKVGAFGDAPLVLITTTGAKSGKSLVTPLVSQPQDDGTLYVFASYAGAPKNPAWYHNLVAHPEVEVEFGTDRFTATATPLTGAERDAIYERQKELFPQFAEYEAKTDRVIPVVALVRTGG